MAQACHIMVVLVTSSWALLAVLAGNMGKLVWIGMAMKGEKGNGELLLWASAATIWLLGVSCLHHLRRGACSVRLPLLPGFLDSSELSRQ